MSKIIYISPENRPKPHGGYTGYAGIYEHDVCTEIGKMLKKELERNGYKAILAVSESTMAQRVEEAKRMSAELYMTIHTNAGGGTGAEVYYYNHPASIKACQYVYDELIKDYPSKRGIKDGSRLFYEIYATPMVSVYPELAFHDNSKDATYLVSHKAELAQALCKGVCKYFGTSYVSEKESETPTYQPSSCENCKELQGKLDKIKDIL